MILQPSEFKLVDRGFEKTLLLIPGWATDDRVFSRLELDYNYLFVSKLHPFCFREDLLKFFENKMFTKVSILGWSLGGFLAKDFALQYPEKIDELVLVSIRKSYQQKELGVMRERLIKNKRACLNRFYADCFTYEDEGYLWFKSQLLKSYIDQWPLEDLLEGLDYLATAGITKNNLTALKGVKAFHGTEDKIAPFEEAQGIASGLPGVRFVSLPKTGHLPFLSSEFRKQFNNG